MIFLKKFNEHSSYESELNGGGVDFKIPSVSYCKDVKDIHYNPYNSVEFYVGEITSPQTVSIYTDSTNHLDVSVSEGNKWYTYVLPKDKGLCRMKGDSVKKAVIKTNISYSHDGDIAIITSSTAEASFKGSNTTNVTDMSSMFNVCSNLTSLDVSNFDTRNVTDMSMMFCDCEELTSLDLSNFNTSNVTDMSQMFCACNNLTSLDLSCWDTNKVTSMSQMFSNCGELNTIRMVGCSQTTIDKIKAQLTADGIINNVTIVTGQTI